MAKFGKWIGGGLGFTVFGPIGALLGFVIGSVIDGSGEEEGASFNKRSYQTKPNDFGASLLVLVAAVMKADGKILKSELEYVRRFFNKQFGSPKTKEHMLVLRELLKKDIPLQEVCLQIKTYTMYPARLQLMHLLFGVAAVDGEVHPLELDIIKQIAAYLGIRQADYWSKVKTSWFFKSTKFFFLCFWEINDRLYKFVFNQCWEMLASRWREFQHCVKRILYPLTIGRNEGIQSVLLFAKHGIPDPLGSFLPKLY